MENYFFRTIFIFTVCLLSICLFINGGTWRRRFVNVSEDMSAGAAEEGDKRGQLNIFFLVNDQLIMGDIIMNSTSQNSPGSSLRKMKMSEPMFLGNFTTR
jgi:hypothetical protein